MKNKKYEILEDDFIIHKGKKLYRIKALRYVYVGGYPSAITIKPGQLGGYVEGYYNLSQEGNCWVDVGAKVYGNARISDDARIEDEAEVFGNARIEDSANIYNNAKVYGNALVIDNSIIGGNAKVYSNARILGMNTVIIGSSKVSGSSVICNEVYIEGADIYDNAKVCARILINSSSVYGNACVSGGTSSNSRLAITSDARVFENAEVQGNIRITFSASVHGNAKIVEVVGKGLNNVCESVSNNSRVSCNFAFLS